MKQISLIIVTIVLVGCAVVKKKNSNSVNPFWTKEKVERHFKNIQDSTSWDRSLFETDLANIAVEQVVPILAAAFPVPDYDLVGKNSFKGVGVFSYSGGDGEQMSILGKTILFNSFYAGTSDINRQYVKEKKNEIFFQIVVLTDLIDSVSYSHVSSLVSSRNHPHYIGEGFYKTLNNKIDYTAFLTANRAAYAIVNMRLFDLSLGKTILIAPQKDKSFRSMQINSPLLSTEDIVDYTNQLIKQNEVISFFTSQGSID